MRKILVVTVVAVTTATGACSVQTLGAPKGGLEFSAEFTDVQSLVVGHSVQMSDVRIGTVVAIKLNDQLRAARVQMQLSPGRKLPQGITASIAKTSLLGENYVKLALPPGGNLASGPMLPDGATITSTAIQPDLESITEQVGPILAAIGGDDLSKIVDATATALANKGPQLNKLIKDVSAVSTNYAAAAKDLQTTIDGMARLGDSLAKSSGELDKMPGRLILATDRIEKDRKELKKSVEDLVALGESFNKNVHARHGARLRTLLQRLDRILKSMVRGKDQLKALTKGITGGFLKAPSLTKDGYGLMQAWLAAFLPLDSDASYVTANNGRGEKPGFGKLRNAISPAPHKKTGE